MRERHFTRALALLLSVFVAAGMLVTFTEKAEAKESRYEIGCPKVIHVGEKSFISVWDRKTNEELIVTSVKTANKKIVKLKSQYWWDDSDKRHTRYDPVGVRPGKTKLTIRFKTAGGKTRTVSRNVKVAAYPDHITSLTVAEKKVRLTKDRRYEYFARCSKTAPVIKMKLKKGWRIQSVEGNYWNPRKEGEIVSIRNGKKLINNGKAFKFPKGYSDFEIMIRMTNGKDSIDYYIHLDR